MRRKAKRQPPPDVPITEFPLGVAEKVRRECIHMVPQVAAVPLDEIFVYKYAPPKPECGFPAFFGVHAVKGGYTIPLVRADLTLEEEEEVTSLWPRLAAKYRAT